MIDETSRFLSWALASQEDVPRIPCRRVDQGGFSQILRKPGARAAAAHWWYRALDRIGT